jgi:hypothetical protein
MRRTVRDRSEEGENGMERQGNGKMAEIKRGKETKLIGGRRDGKEIEGFA